MSGLEKTNTEDSKTTRDTGAVWYRVLAGQVKVNHVFYTLLL